MPVTSRSDVLNALVWTAEQVYEPCREISHRSRPAPPGRSGKDVVQLMAWNDTALVRKYQEPTLEAFTR